MPEDVERALDAGFDQHLAKPPDLHELEQILAVPWIGADKFVLIAHGSPDEIIRAKEILVPTKPETMEHHQ